MRVNGFEYLLRRDRLGKSGKRTWRCRQNKKYKCPASIGAMNGCVLEGQPNKNHSHHGDPIAVIANVIHDVIGNVIRYVIGKVFYSVIASEAEQP